VIIKSIIHCFSAILIKRGVLSLIRISVLSLKDSAYFTDCLESTRIKLASFIYYINYIIYYINLLH